MEDNEFEEVTIISHTDRPHRVFSEKSIEKLKEQISLEIVKEISGTEDKTYSDDPRLAPGLRELEKLKQDHFGEGEGKIPNQTIHFISRVAGESCQYLLGASEAILLSNGHQRRVLQHEWDGLNCILDHGTHWLLFFIDCKIYVVDKLTFKRSEFTDGPKVFSMPSWFFCVTNNFVYYIDVERIHI